MELRVGEKYRMSRKLGSGAFGDIYHGKCNEVGSKLVFRDKYPNKRRSRD